MKIWLLLIFSMIMLGLVAGLVSADAVTGAAAVGGEDTDNKEEAKTGGTLGEPKAQSPADTLDGGAGDDVVQNGPEFSTFGIGAAGALGALSYFFIRRRKNK